MLLQHLEALGLGSLTRRVRREVLIHQSTGALQDRSASGKVDLDLRDELLDWDAVGQTLALGPLRPVAISTARSRAASAMPSEHATSERLIDAAISAKRRIEFPQGVGGNMLAAGTCTFSNVTS